MQLLFLGFFDKKSKIFMWILSIKCKKEKEKPSKYKMCSVHCDSFASSRICLWSGRIVVKGFSSHKLSHLRWYLTLRETGNSNGILLPKLFRPTVRKNCSSDRKNFWNSRLKAKNLKIFEITRTIYSNSERSEQFLAAKCFF